MVEALPAADGRSATYKLTSSVLLSLAVRREASVGEMGVSGSLTRQVWYFGRAGWTQCVWVYVNESYGFVHSLGFQSEPPYVYT